MSNAIIAPVPPTVKQVAIKAISDLLLQGTVYVDFRTPLAAARKDAAEAFPLRPEVAEFTARNRLRSILPQLFVSAMERSSLDVFTMAAYVSLAMHADWREIVKIVADEWDAERMNELLTMAAERESLAMPECLDAPMPHAAIFSGFRPNRSALAFL